MKNKISVLDSGYVILVDYMGDDSSIVQSARVSYGKGTKTINEDRDLVRYLMRHEHMSPFEMCEFKFLMKLPIFCARQIVRHRTASLNETSLRYSEAEEDFYLPTEIYKQSTSNKQGNGDRINEESEKNIRKLLKRRHKSIFIDYKNLLDAGVSREIARTILPISTYTKWYWKVDLRNLFHFLHLRLDLHAQYETRQYAEAMYKLIKPVVPIACEAFENYILNAKTFSMQEMNIIRKIVDISKIDELCACLTKREILELKEKLNI
jgi:thymidylate synthase (FAD)